MVRKVFKRTRFHEKYHDLIVKYKIPRAFLSINRRSVSKGVLIGLFIAFIPMPAQMVAIVLLQPLFRFNLPLAIAMVWITNPLTMPFIYFIEYKTGGFLLGLDNLAPVHMSLTWFQENFDDIMLPLYTGALFYSTLFSVTSYYAVQRLWILSVRKHREQDLDAQTGEKRQSS